MNRNCSTCRYERLSKYRFRCANKNVKKRSNLYYGTSDVWCDYYEKEQNHV